MLSELWDMKITVSKYLIKGTDEREIMVRHESIPTSRLLETAWILIELKGLTAT